MRDVIFKLLHVCLPGSSLPLVAIRWIAGSLHTWPPLHQQKRNLFSVNYCMSLLGKVFKRKLLLHFWELCFFNLDCENGFVGWQTELWPWNICWIFWSELIWWCTLSCRSDYLIKNWHIGEQWLVPVTESSVKHGRTQQLCCGRISVF